MDEKDWKMLVTIYEERNITKAARKLFISQPALTYRIKQLETEFKTNLIARGKKGCRVYCQRRISCSIFKRYA